MDLLQSPQLSNRESSFGPWNRHTVAGGLLNIEDAYQTASNDSTIFVYIKVNCSIFKTSRLYDLTCFKIPL